MIDLTKVKDDWGYTGTPTSGTGEIKPAGEKLGAGESGESGNQEPTGGNTSMVKTPPQWGTATNLLNRMAGSGYYSPSGYNEATNMARDLWSSGGRPTSAQGIWNAQMPQLERAFKTGMDQINETWGARNPGVSGGTGVARAGADAWRTMLENAAFNNANQQGAYNEAAAGRSMQLPSMMAGIAGAQSGDRNAWMGQMGNIAQLLGVQGQREFEAPAFAADAMMRGGAYNQQMSVDPFMGMMANLLSMGAGASKNPTYNVSPMQNILGILGSKDLWGSILGG